ncbi:MAG: DUF4089 domain-containing protein [Hapalosiphonaceae cyanobacterium JJU2]|nr:MAG: DUF4089 domain-containing protein [Hapalosiphonaceae cyanobacterium JJU2]
MNHQEFNVGEYVDQMALLLDLRLRDEYRDGVIANFERIQAIAQLVNSFPLPEDIEVAEKVEMLSRTQLQH